MGGIEEKAKFPSKDLTYNVMKFPPGGPRGNVIPPLHSFSAEQFRRVKTHITLQSPPIRSVLITSTLPQEGKSTVSMNLAIAFAQERQAKTILIDADLRRPHISSEFKSAGLSDYLAGRTAWEDIPLYFASQNLTIIPAGTPSPAAGSLIQSARMGELLENLQGVGENTFILIDSPPVFLASEPLFLSQLVDAVLLVVMADRAPKRAIRKVVDSIGRERFVGVIFVRKDLKPSKYYSRYYHSDYWNP